MQASVLFIGSMGFFEFFTKFIKLMLEEATYIHSSVSFKLFS
jgi:hypothetical protein